MRAGYAGRDRGSALRAGLDPTEATSFNCLASLVKTRTAPADAPASRTMVARNRPSHSSTPASPGKLELASESACNARRRSSAAGCNPFARPSDFAMPELRARERASRRAWAMP